MPKCSACGKTCEPHELDCKPASFASTLMTVEMVEKAADSGLDFNIEQCSTCYGPAFVPGNPPLRKIP